MKTETLNKLAKLSKYLLLAVAVSYIFIYIAVALTRIQYPFEFEWMEGGSLNHVTRILAGKKLYVKPSLEFFPFAYTPLYFYLSAAAAKIVGSGFLPLRLVSFISSLGCFFLIGLIVKRETGSVFWGTIAASLFAATYPASGAWLDLGRVDSLFLLLVLIAIYVLRFGLTWRSDIAAGLIITIAFLTKQTALIVALPLILYCLITDWRRGLIFIATLIIAAGGSNLILNHWHDGWYNYTIFGLTSQNAIDKRWIIGFWTQKIISPLLIATLFSIFYLLNRKSPSDKSKTLFYFLLAGGMIGGAWSSLLNAGGFINGLIPAYAILAILFALGADKILKAYPQPTEDKRNIMAIVINFVCLVQFALLVYNPAPLIPTKKDLSAGSELIRTIQKIQGDVFMPQHSYLAVMAGKRMFIEWTSIFEVLQGDGRGDNEEGVSLFNELMQAISQKKFGAIIFDSNHYKEIIEKTYQEYAIFYEDKTAFLPVTGVQSRPMIMYLPLPSDPQKKAQPEITNLPEVDFRIK